MKFADLKRRAVERYDLSRKVFGRPWARFALALWTFLSTWDLLISQFVPPSWADRFPKVYQVAEMTSNIFPLWVWLVVLALLIAAISFEYAYRQSRRLTRAPVALPALARTPSEAGENKTSQPPALPLEPEKIFISKPLRRATDSLPGWEKLFYLDEDNGDVRLHFMPDTRFPENDTLHLVVFGYEFLKGMDRVPTRRADFEVRRLLLRQERTPLQKIMGMQHTVAALAVGDFGEAAIRTGHMERIDLAKGGAYRLTEDGEAHAFSLAVGLIRRA